MSVNSLHANTTSCDDCIACVCEKHQLYTCSKFRTLPHSEKLELFRSKNHRLNCLRPGHFEKCKSLNQCKNCQKLHHTLLYTDNKGDTVGKSSEPCASASVTTVNSAVGVPITSNALLMTCQVIVETTHGKAKARALVDTGSSATFVSECLAQTLKLRRFTQNAKYVV
jgi:hypothetical protein